MIALLCHPLPPRVADAMTALTRRLAVGNLATAGLESFGGAEVRFTDGRRERFEAAPAASTAPLALEPDEVLDAQGLPRVNEVGSAAPGLYFCGFDVFKTRGGLLREIGLEAKRIAQDISERRSPVARQGLDQSRHINKL